MDQLYDPRVGATTAPDSETNHDRREAREEAKFAKKIFFFVFLLRGLRFFAPFVVNAVGTSSPTAAVVD